ncbi:hypothetical protein [Paenibacillus glufosinatiresistens]|uniref:hypothetical protein n=1 Tax=Paenibacillus glufosinatiresistens TaxID=3070657 RepID=UPI00286E106A|nr:hypothetical protein [Paenibacillus sp. YX.27]
MDWYTGGALTSYVNTNDDPWSTEHFLYAANLAINFVPISAAEAATLKVGQTAEKAGVSLIQKAGQWIKVVIKGEAEVTPEFGRKLEYIFGNATGSKHNIDRSIAMENQLKSIGIFDNQAGRELVLKNLTDDFKDPKSISKIQENGNVVRDPLIAGPNGLIKIESVWDGNKLITVQLYGGK